MARVREAASLTLGAAEDDVMVWSFILPVYEWIFTVFGPSVRAGERAGGLCGGKQPTTERGSFGTAARTPCREAAQIVLAGPVGPAMAQSARHGARGAADTGASFAACPRKAPRSQTDTDNCHCQLSARQRALTD